LAPRTVRANALAFVSSAVVPSLVEAERLMVANGLLQGTAQASLERHS
jgi:hypothetical protein